LSSKPIRKKVDKLPEEVDQVKARNDKYKADVEKLKRKDK